MLTPARFFALAATFAFASCDRESGSPPAQSGPPPSVKLVQPHRGEITRWVTLPGGVVAYQQATLYAKVAGYLKTIAVDKGDAVKEGALLADIEVPEMEADRARYQAEVLAAELDFKRIGEARKKAPDLVMPQSFDEARAKFEIAKANRDRVETLLGYAKITAPFSGIITRRFVDPGAFIPAATSAAQNAALVTLADLTRVRVQVAVPETEVRLIKNGVPVTFSVEGLPGRIFKGSVTRFAQALDDATKTMLAEIEIENADGALRPGMYASVSLGVEKKTDALLLPTDAVKIEKAKGSVFAFADGKAKKIPVQMGFNDGQSIEIADGIKSEQSVIVVGKMPLNDGQPVAIAK